MEQFQKETAIAVVLCFFFSVCFFFAGIAPTEKKTANRQMITEKRGFNENSKSQSFPDCIRF